MESHIGSQLGEIPTTQMEIIEKLLQIKDEIKEEFDKFRARMKNWAEAIPNSTIAGSQSLSINEDPTHGKAYNVLVVGACESEDKAYKVFEEMSHPISIVTTETQGDEDVADKDGDDVLGLSDVEGNLIHEAQKDDQSKGDKLESTKIIYPMAAQGAWLPLIHLQPVLSSEGEGTVNVSATGSPKAWIGESTPELKIVLGKNVMEIDALKVLDKLTEPIQTEESNGGQFISDLPIYVNGNDSYEQLRLDGDAHKVFDQFSPSFRAVRLDEQTYINGIKGAWERFLFDPGGRFLPQMCCDLLELNGEHEDYCLELAASVVDKITAIKNVSESKVSKEIDEGHTMEKQQDESRVASAEDQGEKHATAVVAGGSEQGLSFMEKFDKIGRCTLLVCTSPPHSESNVCGLYIKLSSVNSNEEIYGNNDFLSSFSHILGLNNVDKINWQNDGFYNSFAYEEIVMRYSLAKVYMVDLCFHQCNVYGKYALNLSRGILHPVIRKAHGTCINKVVSSLRNALSTIIPGDNIYSSGSHLILALIFDRITHGKDSDVMVLITLSEKANYELFGSSYFNNGIVVIEWTVFIWDPGLCAIFVYILEDKDVFKRVGKRMIPMGIQLAMVCCVTYSTSIYSCFDKLVNLLHTLELLIGSFGCDSFICLHGQIHCVMSRSHFQDSHCVMVEDVLIYMKSMPTLVPFGDWSVALYGVGVAVYAFEGVGMILPIESEMKQRKKFGKILGLSMAFISLMFGAFGTLGYFAFGEETNDIITTNLGRGLLTSFVQICLCINLFITFPLMMNPVYEVVERRYCEARYSLWVRFVMVLVVTLVALLVPNFADFLSLVGSSVGIVLGFVLPAMFHFIVFNQIFLIDDDRVLVKLVVNGFSCCNNRVGLAAHITL